MKYLTFTVPGTPVPKPRMSQRDKWQKRPCVMRYRAWCDAVRLACTAAGGLPPDPGRFEIIAFLPFPKSYSPAKRAALASQPHRLKPDASNITKAAEDALMTNDQALYHSACIKFWEDGTGPKAFITVWEYDYSCVMATATESDHEKRALAGRSMRHSNPD